MKIEKSSDSPQSDETTAQKQDPLERRRLQNRLSQRNHRRKIRDRIAKLQERVIANELRAAAALNGWDQQFSPSPLISPRHISPHEFKCHMPKDPSLLYKEPIPLFMPPSNFAAVPWPSGMATPLLPSFMSDSPPGLAEQSTFSAGTEPLMPCLPSSMSQMEMQISTADALNEVAFKDILMAEGLPTTTPNQPLCYTATEANLEHLFQMLSTMSPQSKIIILVLPDSTCASAATYPSPSSEIPANTGIEPHQPTQLNMPCGICCCQARNIQSMVAAQQGQDCAPPGTFFS